jgi:hypothetical protein
MDEDIFLESFISCEAGVYSPHLFASPSLVTLSQPDDSLVAPSFKGPDIGESRYSPRLSHEFRASDDSGYSLVPLFEPDDSLVVPNFSLVSGRSHDSGFCKAYSPKPPFPFLTRILVLTNGPISRDRVWGDPIPWPIGYLRSAYCGITAASKEP